MKKQIWILTVSKESPENEPYPDLDPLITEFVFQANFQGVEVRVDEIFGFSDPGNKFKGVMEGATLLMSSPLNDKELEALAKAKSFKP